MLYFDSYRVEDNLQTNCRYIDEANIHPVLRGNEYFARYFPGNGAWTYLIRRTFILSENLFFEEGRYCEDGMFAILSTNKAKKVSYCHTDVYRYVVRKNSITTSNNKAHVLRVIDDFVYAIQYIDTFVKKAMDECDSEEYIKRLVNRRDSYTFFLQARMMKAKLGRTERTERLSCLKKSGCYPNQGLTADYGRKNVLLSKLFQSNGLYNLLCKGYALLK